MGLETYKIQQESVSVMYRILGFAERNAYVLLSKTLGEKYISIQTHLLSEQNFSIFVTFYAIY